jgi:hypothetical protein
VEKVAVDMALSTVSFAGLLPVLCVGIDLVAKDLDKKMSYQERCRVMLSPDRSENLIRKRISNVSGPL